MSTERLVLVVDDEPIICSLIADCLGDWPGTEVFCEHDGRSGVKMLLSGKFSLAIIDVQLPGVSGLDVARVALDNDVPVLMIPGHPEAATNFVLFEIPYLEKPFGMVSLMLKVKAALASSPENVNRVRASLARLQDSATSLQIAMAESRRLLGESLQASARAEGRASR